MNKTDETHKKIVMAITGASGAALGIHTLKLLQSLKIETHLIISQAGEETIHQETDFSMEKVRQMASFSYNVQDIGARVASGSFGLDGMLIIPCSIKTLSAVANCYADNLITRTADVCLKEGRPLLLAVREAPLHRGHLRLMDLAAQAGAIIFPPVPAFYTKPNSMDEILDNIAGRMLLRLGIQNDKYCEWNKAEKIS